MRKAREPNDKLDRATDRTLAEADRKVMPPFPTASSQCYNQVVRVQQVVEGPRQ